jgi:hypothetical protein
MIYRIQARDRLGRTVIHEVEIGDRKIELHAPDLRGISLENAHLNGADLRFANLSGVCLRGARLREAILDHANLGGADLSYTDLSGASLREADLRGTLLYPAETIGANFYGAKFAPDSDAAEYARIALEEMCRRVRIRPSSVAFRKLQRINGFYEFLAPAQAPPATRGRAHYFVESL